jgi:hypothetical protein
MRKQVFIFAKNSIALGYASNMVTILRLEDQHQYKLVMLDTDKMFLIYGAHNQKFGSFTDPLDTSFSLIKERQDKFASYTVSISSMIISRSICIIIILLLLFFNVQVNLLCSGSIFEEIIWIIFHHRNHRIYTGSKVPVSLAQLCDLHCLDRKMAAFAIITVSILELTSLPIFMHLYLYTINTLFQVYAIINKLSFDEAYWKPRYEKLLIAMNSVSQPEMYSRLDSAWDTAKNMEIRRVGDNNMDLSGENGKYFGFNTFQIKKM